MLCAVVLRSNYVGSIPGAASYELYDLGKLRDVFGNPPPPQKKICLIFFISKEFRTMSGKSYVLNKC